MLPCRSLLLDRAECELSYRITQHSEPACAWPYRTTQHSMPACGWSYRTTQHPEPACACSCRTTQHSVSLNSYILSARTPPHCLVGLNYHITMSMILMYITLRFQLLTGRAGRSAHRGRYPLMMERRTADDLPPLPERSTPAPSPPLQLPASPRKQPRQ